MAVDVDNPDKICIDLAKRMLTRGGTDIKLAHRPLNVLLHLIEQRDHLVGRQELIERFWNGSDVYDEAVTKCIGAIRKALDDPTDDPNYIETRWAEGYRFIGRLTDSTDSTICISPAGAKGQQTHRRNSLAKGAAAAALVLLLLIGTSAFVGMRWWNAAAAGAAKPGTNNPEAEAAYVQGRYLWKKKNPESLEKARRLFEEAIRLDPTYAEPHAGLADYYLTGVWYANFVPADAVEKARPAAQRALELNDRLAEAYIIRGRVAEMEWDWLTMRQNFEKAIEIDPESAHAWHGYAFYLHNVEGDSSAAVEAMRRAARLDPVSISISCDLGLMLIHAGQSDEAISTLHRAINIDPNFSDAFNFLGLAYEVKKIDSQAIAAYLEAMRIGGETPENIKNYRKAYERNGLQGYWQLRVDSKKAAANSALQNTQLASLNARIGDRAAALDYIERAFQDREPLLVGLRSDLAFYTLRGDPKYEEVLRRMRFPHLDQ